MLKRIKRLLGIGVPPKPLKKDGPFATAAAEVSLLEAADRARWEERERQWEARGKAMPVRRSQWVVVYPGGACLCRRCGHPVGPLQDACINCWAPLSCST